MSRRCHAGPNPVRTPASTIPGFEAGERYVDILRCGGVTWLTSRLQPDLAVFEWETLLRPFADGVGGRATRLLPRQFNMSHNAVLLCANRTVHSIGGHGEGSQRSTRRTMRTTPRASPGPSTPRAPTRLKTPTTARNAIEEVSAVGFRGFDGEGS